MKTKPEVNSLQDALPNTPFQFLKKVLLALLIFLLTAIVVFKVSKPAIVEFNKDLVYYKESIEAENEPLL